MKAGRHLLSVADAAARPRNAFTPLRLILALCVVVSHQVGLTTGDLWDEPLARSTGFTLGDHAVSGFFAISGFLVTGSLVRRGWRDYLVARLLRILPGLVAAVTLTALVLGAVVTRLPLPEYFGSPDLWRFLPQVSLSFKSANTLPGVFTENPRPFAMATVWTLKYELLCYLGLLLCGLAGLMGRPRLAAATVAVLFGIVVGIDLLWPQAPLNLTTTARLALLFATGSALWTCGGRMPLSPAILAALAAVTWLCYGTAAGHGLLFLTEAYGVIVLALHPRVTSLLPDTKADLSYGVYLYGYPIQQALIQAMPGVGPWLLAGPAIAASLGIAALSWYGVEKPALALKERLVSPIKLPRAVVP